MFKSVCNSGEQGKVKGQVCVEGGQSPGWLLRCVGKVSRPHVCPSSSA